MKAISKEHFNYQIFSERLNRQRELLGWGITETAQVLGVSAAYVSNLCRGYEKGPSAEVLIRICIRMNLSADYLLGID